MREVHFLPPPTMPEQIEGEADPNSNNKQSSKHVKALGPFRIRFTHLQGRCA
jgi:hypothetical protein